MRAIVLAAGRGLRLGDRPKAILDLGGETALARVVRAAREAAFAPLVVVGAHRDPVEAEARRLGVPVVANAAWERGRTGSLQAGWSVPGPALLWPVDVPLAKAETARALAAAYDAARAAVPVHAGRRGHPVLLGADLRDAVLQLHPDAPLHAVVRERAREVPVDDEGVLVDVNTPEAYREALARLRRGAPRA